jgi:hypothetical protein
MPVYMVLQPRKQPPSKDFYFSSFKALAGLTNMVNMDAPPLHTTNREVHHWIILQDDSIYSQPITARSTLMSCSYLLHTKNCILLYGKSLYSNKVSMNVMQHKLLGHIFFLGRYKLQDFLPCLEVSVYTEVHKSPYY